MKLSRWLSPQFLKFSGIGGGSTGIQYVMLIVMVQRFHVAAILASCIAFVTSTVMSYILNRRYTFKTDRSHSSTLWQYFAIYLVGCGINASVMWVGMHVFLLYYLIAQVLASMTVVSWTYNSCRLWAFKN